MRSGSAWRRIISQLGGVKLEVSLGLRVPCSQPASEIGKMAAFTEAAGFDAIWYLDSQLLSRDAWIAMTLSTMQTQSIKIGVNVTNPITRHPSVTASAASTLEELAPGRILLGLGAGSSSVLSVGLKQATRQELRTAVAQIRGLQSGAYVDIQGCKARLQIGTGQTTPIYMTASGPRMLELAGEIGDGVTLMTGLTPHCVNYSLNRVGIGAAKAHRNLDDLNLILGAFCHPGPKSTESLDRLRPICAGYLNNYRALLQEINFPIPTQPDADESEDVLHAENWESAIDKTRTWLSDEVVAEFAETFCLMGAPIEIAQKIEGIVRRGSINGLFIRGLSSHHYPYEVVRAFNEVIPILRQRGIIKSGRG